MSNVLDPNKIKESEEDTGSSLRDQLKDHPEQVDQELAGIAAATSKAQPDQVGDGFKEGSQTSRQKFFGRRGKIAVGAVGLAVGGGLSFFTIVQGPLQLIHFGNILSQFHFSIVDDFTNGRTIRFMNNARRASLGTAVADTRLGRLGNKLADKVELRLNDRAGIRSLYDTSTGKLLGYEIIDQDKAIDTLGDIDGDAPDFSDAPDSERNRFTRLDGSEIEGRIIQFNDEKLKVQRRFTGDVLDVVNHNKIASKVSARLLTKRGGINFHPIDSAKRSAGQRLVDFYRDKRDARSQEHKTGELDRQYTGQDGITDDDGNRIDRTEDGTDFDTDEVADEINKLADDIDKPGGKLDVKGIARNVGQKAKGPAVIAAILCAATDLSGAIDEGYLAANVIAPMMRMGGSFVTAASQVQALSAGNLQDVSLDSIGELVQLLHSDEFGSAFGAASIQFELGQKITGVDIGAEARLKDGTIKPEALRFLDSLSWIGAACGTVDNIISTAISFIPGGKFVEEVQEKALNGALSVAGTSSDELLEGLLRLITGAAIDTYATGAKLGNYANHGSRWAANEQFLSLGGENLSDTESAQLKSITDDYLHEEFVASDITERLFSLQTPRSLFGNILRISPTSSSSLATALLISPTSLFSASSFVNKASAQESSYDYGFDEVGFSLADQQDERFEDPYEIQQYLYEDDGDKTRLQRMNEEYGEDCFGLRIDEDGNISQSNEPKTNANLPEKCIDNREQDFLYYRFYIADTFTLHSLACYEGIDEASCAQIGFGGSSSPSESSTGTTAGAEIVGDPFSESESVECAPETTDLGVHDGYNRGALLKIRLCAIPNLPSSSSESNPGNSYYVEGADGRAIVSSRVSGAVYSMVADAANAGVTLRASSSFRTMAHQQSLYSANPNPSLVARPGTSNHQTGLAIDFSGMSSVGENPCTASNRARAEFSEGWIWLRDNAQNYGYRQYSKEAWHWDPSNGANSCDSSI